MQPLMRGRYEARLAESPADIAEAQHLRYLAFWTARGRSSVDGRDCDAFDAAAMHLLIRDRVTGDLVGCFRATVFQGDGIAASYSASVYDLQHLARFPGPMMEVGRFCLHPDQHDADILRLAWAAMARLVDDQSVTLLFGCSSFIGADPARHAAAFGLLAGRFAPVGLRPGPRAPNRVELAPFADKTAGAGGLAQMPALLRTYLSMGGWVSDHAVIDHDLDTLHVLTAVEIATIPPARARALRLIAAESLG